MGSIFVSHRCCLADDSIFEVPTPKEFSVK